MENTSRNIFSIRIFIILFFVFNLFSIYLILDGNFNINIMKFDSSLMMVISSFFGNLAFLMILFSLTLFFRKNKSFLIALIIINIIITTLLYLIQVHIFFYGSIFSFFGLKVIFGNISSAPHLANDVQKYAISMFFNLKHYLVILPGLIFTILGVVYLIKNKKKEEKFRNFSFLKNIKIATICFTTGLSMIVLTQAYNSFNLKKSNMNELYIPLKEVQNMGLFNFYLKDLINYVFDNPDDTTENEAALAELDSWINDNLKDKESFESYIPKGYSENKNVLLLQLESLNNFVINAKVNNQEITPFLNSLINNEKALYYDRFFSSAGIGKTSDSEFSALTGFYSAGSHIAYYNDVYNNYETLPKLFNAKGYNSYAINGNYRGFYDRINVYKKLGFPESNYFGLDNYSYEEKDLSNGWLRDNFIFDDAVNLLSPNGDSFVFALSTNTHLPYPNIEGITGKFDYGNEYKNTLISNYFDYVHHLDENLAFLFKRLEESGKLDNTVIMMYGDHTSTMLFDDMKLFRKENNSYSKEDYNYDMLNVPFFIYGANNLAQKEKINTHLVRNTTSIKSTLSYLLNLEEEYHLGVNIISDEKTFIYNPQFFNIINDEIAIFQDNKYILNGALYNDLTTAELNAEILRIQNQVLDFRRYNDKILKYKYFK